MAAPKQPTKRLFQLKDAVQNSAGQYVPFGLSSSIDEVTVKQKLDSGEWVEVTKGTKPTTGD